MSDNGKEARITVETLKAALRTVADGGRWERRDPDCRGLRLRVGVQSGARWSYKGRLAGIEKRWDLGPVVASREALEDVRARAARYRECLRRDQDPEAVPAPAPAPVAEAPLTWIWEEAVDAFLARVKDELRPDTYTDYKFILRNKGEIARFQGRRVAEITRLEIGRLIADIYNRGVQSHAKHVLRVVRSMWSWLGEGEPHVASGVQPNLLLRLKPPAGNQRETGDRRVHEGAPAVIRREPHKPEGRSIGRAVAIARAGVLDERISLALQLLIFTAQRRRTIVNVHADHLDLADAKAPAGVCVWTIPPFFRKTARRNNDQRPHRLPLSGSAAQVAADFLELEESENHSENQTSGLLLPVQRPRIAGVKPLTDTMDPSVLNHNLLFMPRVRLSPHAVRHAFASYGVEELGWSDDDSALVLDHNEGRVGKTTEHYNWTEHMARKHEILSLWAEWIDEHARIAIDEDPLLRPENRDRLKDELYRCRYDLKVKARKKRPLGSFTSNDDDLFAMDEKIYLSEKAAGLHEEPKKRRGPKPKRIGPPPPKIILSPVPSSILGRRPE